MPMNSWNRFTCVYWLAKYLAPAWFRPDLGGGRRCFFKLPKEWIVGFGVFVVDCSTAVCVLAELDDKDDDDDDAIGSMLSAIRFEKFSDEFLFGARLLAFACARQLLDELFAPLSILDDEVAAPLGSQLFRPTVILVLGRIRSVHIQNEKPTK